MIIITLIITIDDAVVRERQRERVRENNNNNNGDDIYGGAPAHPRRRARALARE